MNEKALRILEYHKIINLLTDKATSAPGKELCHVLKPMTDIEKIEEAQRQTADAFSRLVKGERAFRRRTAENCRIPCLYRKGKSIFAHGTR